jgi:cobalt-zinc-cadmium efflux system membrane fusion protein
MTSASQSSSRIGVGIALLVAMALGFGIARFTGRSPPAIPPVPQVEGSKALTLDLPESYLGTMDIGVEAAVAGDLGAEIQAPATVMASANSVAVVTTPAAGTVTRLEKRLGDAVRAGEILARLQGRDAAQIASELAAAESRSTLAASALKREQDLFDQHVTPRQDLEAAQAAAAAASAEATRARSAASAAHVSADGSSMAVVSPIAGRITSASAQLGAFVAPETELFRIADPRSVVVEASVPALDASRISAGDMAVVTSSSGQSLAATVKAVTPTVNEQTRAATVLLSLAAGHAALMPGEIAKALITPRSGIRAGVVVPEDAVQVVDGRNVVFVRTVTGFIVKRVTVGTRSGRQVMLLAGLEAGAKIATRNAFLLKAEFAKGAADDEE